MKRYIENEVEETNKKLLKREDGQNSNKAVKKYFKLIDKSKNDILNDSIQGNMGLMAHAIEIEYKKLHATEILSYKNHICQVGGCKINQLYVRISYTNINTSDIDFVLRNSTVDDDDDFIDQQIYHIAFLTGEQFRDEFEKSHNKQLRKANIETTELLLANLYVCEKTGAVHVCGEEYCRIKNNKVKGNYICPLTGRMLGAVLSHDLDWITPIHYTESSDKFNKQTGCQFMSEKKLKNSGEDNKLDIIIKIVKGLLFSTTRQIHEISLLKQHYSKIKTIIKSLTKKDKTNVDYYDACSTIAVCHLKQLKQSDYFLKFPIINNSIKKIISSSLDRDDDFGEEEDDDDDVGNERKNIKKNKHTCNQNNNNNNRRQKSFSKQKINNTNNNDNNNCSTCELNRLLIRRNQILKESREEEEGDLKRFDKEIYEFSNLILKILSTITEKYNKSLYDMNSGMKNVGGDGNQLSLFVESKKSNYNNGRKRDVLPKFPQLVIYIMYIMKAGGMKIPSRKKIINEKENIFIIPNQQDTVTVIPPHSLAKYLPPEDSLDIYKSETMFESLQTVKISDISDRMSYFVSVILENTNPIELDITA